MCKRVHAMLICLSHFVQNRKWALFEQVFFFSPQDSCYYIHFTPPSLSDSALQCSSSQSSGTCSVRTADQSASLYILQAATKGVWLFLQWGKKKKAVPCSINNMSMSSWLPENPWHSLCHFVLLGPPSAIIWPMQIAVSVCYLIEMFVH